MKSSLLLFSLAAVLSLAAPARAQYIYLDTNGDGVCTNADILFVSTTHVDIYLDTNHTASGSAIPCNDGTHPLDIGSYDLLLHSAGPGSVMYGAWTNEMAGYTEQDAPTAMGADFGVGYSDSSGAFTAPGPHKLGTLQVSVAGNPILSFLTVAPFGIPSPVTGFGSECSGSDYPNTITLGLDFSDYCTSGGNPYDSVEATTWGKIKQIYR